MSFRSRRRMQTRHMNTNAWPPGEHNAMKAYRKASRAAERERIEARRRAARAASTFKYSLAGAAEAAAIAGEKMRIIVQELSLAAGELMRQRAEILAYGRAAGLDDEDIDYIINAAVRHALLVGGPPDWARMRDRIDAAYVMNALS